MHWLDPDYLPITQGTLERFVLNPKGDIDGLLLSDDIEVHTPPHWSGDLQSHLHVGDPISVRGLRPRLNTTWVAVAIDTPSDHRIEDTSPEHAHKGQPHARQEHSDDAVITGTVIRLLHGPKGDPHGALLSDGTFVRFPPHAYAAFAPVLECGKTICGKGRPLTTSMGVVLDVKALGTSARTLTARSSAPKKHATKKHAPKKHASKKPA